MPTSVMQNKQHPLAIWRQSQTPRVTQEQFAKLLSVDPWTVKSIEKGRRNPSPELAARIASSTGIPMVALRPDLAAFAAPSKQTEGV